MHILCSLARSLTLSLTLSLICRPVSCADFVHLRHPCDISHICTICVAVWLPFSHDFHYYIHFYAFCPIVLRVIFAISINGFNFCMVSSFPLIFHFHLRSSCVDVFRKGFRHLAEQTTLSFSQFISILNGFLALMEYQIIRTCKNVCHYFATL